ncbi:hypothetical protein JW949_00505 [Candidatus Woesearchaeota archaeon]|nr:hypothetical protein [Candidatus Woesearchaeota archaeon]
MNHNENEHNDKIMLSLILTTVAILVLLISDNIILKGLLFAGIILLQSMVLYHLFNKEKDFSSIEWYVFGCFIFTCIFLALYILTPNGFRSLFGLQVIIMDSLGIILFNVLPENEYLKETAVPMKEIKIEKPKAPSKEDVFMDLIREARDLKMKEEQKKIDDITKQTKRIEDIGKKFEKMMKKRKKSKKKKVKKETKKEKYSLIGTKSGNKYHKPGCRMLKNVPKKEIIRFEDRKQANNKGYTKCKFCQ